MNIQMVQIVLNVIQQIYIVINVQMKQHVLNVRKDMHQIQIMEHVMNVVMVNIQMVLNVLIVI